MRISNVMHDGCLWVKLPLGVCMVAVVGVRAVRIHLLASSVIVIVLRMIVGMIMSRMIVIVTVIVAMVVPRMVVIMAMPRMIVIVTMTLSGQ